MSETVELLKLLTEYTELYELMMSEYKKHKENTDIQFKELKNFTQYTIGGFVDYDKLQEEQRRCSEILFDTTKKFGKAELRYDDKDTIEVCRNYISDIAYNKAWLRIYPYRLMIDSIDIDFDSIINELSIQTDRFLQAKMYAVLIKMVREKYDETREL
jgi:hypothetical protein